MISLARRWFSGSKIPSRVLTEVGEVEDVRGVEQRLEIFWEVMEKVKEEKVSVLSLGCSKGVFTLSLLDRLVDQRPGSTIVGVDRCPSKIDEATKSAVEVVKKKFSGDKEKCTTVLRNLILFPLDGTKEWLPKAPYHVIEVSFLPLNDNIKIFDNLVKQLRYDGFLIYPSQKDKKIKILQKVRTSKDLQKVLTKSDVNLSNLPGFYTPGVLVDGETPANEKRRDLLQAKLKQWRDDFELKNKRKANRNDIINDPVSNKLFTEFSALNKLK